jgi:hypothetical protein
MHLVKAGLGKHSEFIKYGCIILMLIHPSGRDSQVHVNQSGDIRILGPVVDWTPIASLIRSYTTGRTLFIMDCCFAAQLGTYDGPELLAATGWDNEASGDPQRCLTRVLIDELRTRNGGAATVAQIFASMHRNSHRTQLLSSIVHIPQMNCSSIVLEKLPSKRTKPEPFSARQAVINQFLPSQYRVLISVNLQNDITPPDLEQWKKWLMSDIPSGLLSTDIRIETVFPAGSCVVLVTVPVEVWTMLPIREEAYSFVAFVKGHGALPSEQPVLTLRLRGTENVIPGHRRGQSDDVLKRR